MDEVTLLKVTSELLQRDQGCQSGAMALKIAPLRNQQLLKSLKPSASHFHFALNYHTLHIVDHTRNQRAQKHSDHGVLVAPKDHLALNFKRNSIIFYTPEIYSKLLQSYFSITYKFRVTSA